jgi:hypothetical protein
MYDYSQVKKKEKKIVKQKTKNKKGRKKEK